MKSSDRENFLRVIRRDNPWKVSYPIPVEYVAYLGAWPNDSRPSPDCTEWKDLWGVTWEVSEGETFPTVPAISSVADIDRLPKPDPHAAALREKLADDMSKIDREKTTVAMFHPYFLYENGFNILGAEEFLATLAADEDGAEALFDRVFKFEMGIAEEYIKYKPEQIRTLDDYGMQSSMAVSPDMWRRYFKPRLKKIYDFYRRELGKDLIISHHSCGHVMPILEDFIELGLDILDPMQSNSNDMESVARMTRGRLVISGAIDGQRILPFGTPTQIREEVFRKMSLFWDNGGYLPMPEKTLGVSRENIKVMEDAIYEWSRLHVENKGRR